MRVEKVPSVFFPDVWRLIRKQDLVLLVEGSAYMDTWSMILLWAFLWTTYCAHVMRIPCLAYAVDAGQLRRFDRWLVKHVVSKTDLIVARSDAAAKRLRAWGVSAQMETTADNALTYEPSPADRDVLAQLWPESTNGKGVAGLAPVDFSLFPVVIRPWGLAEDCYRWQLYFSRSPRRRQASEALAAGYAHLADRLVEVHDLSVALIAMEQLDERLARAVRERMLRPERAHVFSSRELNASQMTNLLRSLDVLATSRYHACILSLAAAVPQLAVGHDLRLKTLYRELGLIDYFVEPGPAMFSLAEQKVEQLLTSSEPVRTLLRAEYSALRQRAQRNRKLLAAFVAAHGFLVEDAWNLAAWFCSREQRAFSVRSWRVV